MSTWYILEKPNNFEKSELSLDMFCKSQYTVPIPFH
jgi:hypothetical protein